MPNRQNRSSNIRQSDASPHFYQNTVQYMNGSNRDGHHDHYDSVDCKLI